MESKNKFTIGSNYFFKDKFEDFESKDIDELVILDRPLNIADKSIKVLNAKMGDKDVFFYWPMNKDEFIKHTLDSEVAMKAGKFLVKEFAKDFLGMTIDDLKKLEEMFQNIDDKHTYEKYIYKSYIENNDWVMTEEQLNKAYEIYKAYKNEIS